MSPSGERVGVSAPPVTVEALAAEVGPLAYGVALRMLGDPAAAEDALQDAFVQAHAHAFTTASNEAGDESRQLSRELEQY